MIVAKHEAVFAALPFQSRTDLMLFTIAIILLVLWALGAFVFPVGGGIIHVLLVIALIVVVYRLLTGRKVV
jgi:hypothetical protein